MQNKDDEYFTEELNLSLLDEHEEREEQVPMTNFTPLNQLPETIVLKFKDTIICRVEREPSVKFYKGSYLVCGLEDSVTLTIDQNTNSYCYVVNYNNKLVYIPTELVTRI